MAHCTCLYEIENNLPRTQYCFMPCEAQREILRQRQDKQTALTMRPSATIIAELSVRVTELDTLNRIMDSVKRSALIKEIYGLAVELRASVEYERLITELKASEIL